VLSSKRCTACTALLESTMQQEPLTEYASRLAVDARDLIQVNHLLNKEQKQSLKRTIERLLAQITVFQRNGTSCSIWTALTHGDLQPANILIDGQNVWLIDWEYSARRQAGYDALTLGLGARFPSGLSRWGGREMIEIFDSAVAKLGPWPGLDWADATHRYVHIALFLLEELVLHLEENANPRFVNVGEGLKIIWREIDIWIEGASCDS
jgi:hypothetical protein